MEVKKISESEKKEFLLTKPAVRLDYDSYKHVINKNKKEIEYIYNYKIEINEVKPIVRLLLNLKSNFSKIKEMDGEKYIESKYLAQRINNLWSASSDSSSFSGHNSNVFISRTIKNKKYSQILDNLYEIVCRLSNYVITNENEMIEITEDNIKNIFGREDLEFLFFDNVDFKELLYVHLKLVNSYLKKVQENFDGTECSILDYNGNNICFLKEEMTKNGYSFKEGTEIKKIIGKENQDILLNELSKNGYSLSRQKFWVKRGNDKELDIILIPYLLLLEPEKFNSYNNNNYLDSTSLKLNQKELKGTLKLELNDGFNINFSTRHPLTYFRSIIEPSKTMTKEEFYNNINYKLYQKVDFKESFNKALTDLVKMSDEQLKLYLKLKEFHYLRIEVFKDPRLLDQENINVYWKADKKVRVRKHKRKGTKFDSNDKGELLIGSLIQDNFRLNREEMLGIIKLDEYIYSVSQNTLNRIGVELEQKVSKKNGKEGYLDAIVKIYADQEIIEDELKEMLGEDTYNRLSEEKKHSFLKKISLNSQSEILESKVFEYKSFEKQKEESLKEQCESYLCSEYQTQKTQILDKCLPKQYTGKVFNNIQTYNFVLQDNEVKTI